MFNITFKTPRSAAPFEIKNISLTSCGFGFSFTRDSCTCVNIKNQDRMISRCDGKYVYLYKNVWAYPSQKAAFIMKNQLTFAPTFIAI